MRQRLALMRLVFRMSWRASRARSVAVLALTALRAVSSGLMALGLQQTVDGAVTGRWGAALAGAVLAAVAYALEGVGERARGTLRHDLSLRTARLLDRDVLAATAALPGLEHLERPEYLDRLSLLRGSGGALAGSFWGALDTLSAVLRLAFAISLLVAVHPALGLLPALAVPSLLLAKRGKSVEQRARRATAERERADAHLVRLLTEPGSAMQVRVAGCGDILATRADAHWHEVTRAWVRAKVRAAWLGSLSWALFTVGYVAGLVLVTWLVLRGDQAVGAVVLLISLASQLRTQVGTAVFGVAAMTEGWDTVDHFAWLRAYANERKPQDCAPAPDRLTRGIALRGVSFRYPGTEQEVLSDVDIELPAGAVVALVGANGTGKTTLVKLLCGFYQPTSGVIEVDGVPLAGIDPARWRQRISGGYQDFARLQFLLRESVGVGDLPRIADEAAVRRSLERVDAAGIPRDLADGLETQLGLTFDGVELSHGQWQKLGVARSFMRPAPLLLVLDEPTAALDARTEHHLFEQYIAQSRAIAATHGGIALLVSHRFSTVRHAQLIVVCDNGKVSEHGSHDQLMAAGGRYAELYERQAAAYR